MTLLVSGLLACVMKHTRRHWTTNRLHTFPPAIYGKASSQEATILKVTHTYTDTHATNQPSTRGDKRKKTKSQRPAARPIIHQTLSHSPDGLGEQKEKKQSK
jgi:hypothetical protein